ncbi:MAG TPA: hypothetical protein VFY18_10140 [Candidatus Limnocylindrales bacterium]|nr:hypothetical protein [Candidatus Limnocylindrales bacterium]
MTRHRRFLSIALALLLGPAIVGTDPAISLARMTDSAASTMALTTDTLAPPTSLTATGGTSVALGWTITTDAYATGYEVHRGTVSGGPYSQVATVTPRAATSTTDAPGSSGTYYYVLRSYFQNWTSVNGNQASAVVTLGPTATGFNGCTGASNAADTGGDGNGYETLPANACGDDLVNATDVGSGTNTTISCTDAGKDRHRFWDFGLGVPGTVSAVNGIEVRTDVGMNNNGGTSQVCIQLSWDAGSTWTTAKSVALAGTAIATYNFGTAGDNWGHTWLGSELSNANFRVRVIDVTSQPNKDFLLEYLAVQVTYTP